MPGVDLRSLLRSPIDVRALGAHLDALPHLARLAAIRSFTARNQADLYDVARGVRPISVEDIVPSAHGPGRPVIHHGKNSLFLFTRFQKRFCRTRANPSELAGYNHQAMSLFTGPGYFVAYDLPDGEVLVDYTRLPTERAPGWPRILSNDARLSRWIYRGTQDTLRGVGSHVSIGRAARKGVPMPNWFVLCREDPELPALGMPGA